MGPRVLPAMKFDGKTCDLMEKKTFEGLDGSTFFSKNGSRIF